MKIQPIQNLVTIICIRVPCNQDMRHAAKRYIREFGRRICRDMPFCRCLIYNPVRKCFLFRRQLPGGQCGG